MEKVNKEWFKQHGFTIIEYPNGKIICTLNKDKKIARWDYNPPEEDGDTGFYQFYCSGDGFKITNNISEETYWDYQILYALKIVGL